MDLLTTMVMDHPTLATSMGDTIMDHVTTGDHPALATIISTDIHTLAMADMVPPITDMVALLPLLVLHTLALERSPVLQS